MRPDHNRRTKGLSTPWKSAVGSLTMAPWRQNIRAHGSDRSRQIARMASGRRDSIRIVALADPFATGEDLSSFLISLQALPVCRLSRSAFRSSRSPSTLANRLRQLHETSNESLPTESTMHSPLWCAGRRPIGCRSARQLPTGPTTATWSCSVQATRKSGAKFFT